MNFLLLVETRDPETTMLLAICGVDRRSNLLFFSGKTPVKKRILATKHYNDYVFSNIITIYFIQVSRHINTIYILQEDMFTFTNKNSQGDDVFVAPYNIDGRRKKRASNIPSVQVTFFTTAGKLRPNRSTIRYTCESPRGSLRYGHDLFLGC